MGTGAARVIGVNLDEWAVACTRKNFSASQPALEFFAQDATRLIQLDVDSVDVVASFETLEHCPTPASCLGNSARVLKPGELFIGSASNLWINEQGHNPIPYHLHIYDHEQFHEQVARHFNWPALYRQNAGGGWKRPQPRIFRAIPACALSDEDRRDIEW